MKGRIFKLILVLLLAADICYSFRQHYHMFLDGDLATVVLPSEGCAKVLTDPFGFSALKGERYFAPNRFFAHASMYAFFNTVPFVCQNFVDPVDSLYLTCAIAKTGFQVFLIWILAVYISGRLSIFSKEFLISAVLVTPLFQTWGFNQSMGIIDQSISYAFAYAFPLGLILLYFLPFYLAQRSQKSFKPGWITSVLLMFLAVVIAFNGPICPPIMIIICSLLLLNRWLNKKPFDKRTLFFLLFTILLSFYSYYIGTFNDAFAGDAIPLVERFKLLFRGLWVHVHSWGVLLLFIMIIINSVVLFKWKDSLPHARSILHQLKWILIFSAIYILLLPFGGYRIYRPFIIRYDTIMPVHLGLFYYYGISTLLLLTRASIHLRWVYGLIIVSFSLIFTVKDQNNYIVNQCERESLKLFAQSKDKIVLFKNNCNIMAWNKIIRPYDSRWNTQYLKKIGVINEEKYYYQE